IKSDDEHADRKHDVLEDQPGSVKSGLTVEEIAEQPDARLWKSNRKAGRSRPLTEADTAGEAKPAAGKTTSAAATARPAAKARPWCSPRTASRALPSCSSRSRKAVTSA